MSDSFNQITFDERLRSAREAARELAVATTAEKNAALEAIAAGVEADEAAILAENEHDLVNAKNSGASEHLLDRLMLNPQRIAALATAVRHVASLPDPVGDVVRGHTLENGLQLTQVRVPFGVVGAIYEARPNVTVDIATLALKSGNCAVLRGGSAAAHTNDALLKSIHKALAGSTLPESCVVSIDDFGRDGAGALMRARRFIDVLIPRGGSELIQRVVAESTVPVIETGAGNVHVFIDASANADMAREIVLNAKTQRPSVCNAAETLLIHRDASPALVKTVIEALREAGVDVRADSKLRDIDPTLSEVTDEDFSTEFHSLTLAAKFVDSVDEAISHIERYSTRHTETIVTNDLANAERFLSRVDSAVVMVNASTRFTDGGEFGFGAEVGISTQKLHARGPMGLPELTSTKWLVRGTGQVRH